MRLWAIFRRLSEFCSSSLWVCFNIVEPEWRLTATFTSVLCMYSVRDVHNRPTIQYDLPQVRIGCYQNHFVVF
jgi:hypothetical protein